MTNLLIPSISSDACVSRTAVNDRPLQRRNAMRFNAPAAPQDSYEKAPVGRRSAMPPMAAGPAVNPTFDVCDIDRMRQHPQAAALLSAACEALDSGSALLQADAIAARVTLNAYRAAIANGGERWPDAALREAAARVLRRNGLQVKVVLQSAPNGSRRAEFPRTYRAVFLALQNAKAKGMLAGEHIQEMQENSPAAYFMAATLGWIEALSRCLAAAGDAEPHCLELGNGDAFAACVRWAKANLGDGQANRALAAMRRRALDSVYCVAAVCPLNEPEHTLMNLLGQLIYQPQPSMVAVLQDVFQQVHDDTFFSSLSRPCFAE